MSLQPGLMWFTIGWTSGIWMIIAIQWVARRGWHPDEPPPAPEMPE